MFRWVKQPRWSSLTRGWAGRGCIFEATQLFTCLGKFLSFINTKPFHPEFGTNLPPVKKCWIVCFCLGRYWKHSASYFKTFKNSLWEAQLHTATGGVCPMFVPPTTNIPASHFHSKGKQVWGSTVFHNVLVTPGHHSQSPPHQHCFSFCIGSDSRTRRRKAKPRAIQL